MPVNCLTRFSSGPPVLYEIVRGCGRRRRCGAAAGATANGSGSPPYRGDDAFAALPGQSCVPYEGEPTRWSRRRAASSCAGWHDRCRNRCLGRGSLQAARIRWEKRWTAISIRSSRRCRAGDAAARPARTGLDSALFLIVGVCWCWCWAGSTGSTLPRAGNRDLLRQNKRRRRRSPR